MFPNSPMVTEPNAGGMSMIRNQGYVGASPKKRLFVVHQATVYKGVIMMTHTQGGCDGHNSTHGVKTHLREHLIHKSANVARLIVTEPFVHPVCGSCIVIVETVRNFSVS